jgi:hypothetical protein
MNNMTIQEMEVIAIRYNKRVCEDLRRRLQECEKELEIVRIQYEEAERDHIELSNHLKQKITEMHFLEEMVK